MMHGREKSDSEIVCAGQRVNRNCSGGMISPGFTALFLGCVGLADVSQPHCDAPT